MKLDVWFAFVGLVILSILVSKTMDLTSDPLEIINFSLMGYALFLSGLFSNALGKEK